MRDVLTRGRASFALLALAVGAFAFNTVEMMPLGLLPQLAASFGLAPGEAGAFMSGYALVVAIATVPLVRLSSRLPQKWVVVGLLLGLATCTAVFASTASTALAFTSRLVTAAAHGLMWSLMAPLAVAQFASHLRGRVLSLLSVGAALSAVLGVPGVTLLGARAGWRPAMSVIVLLALLAALTVALHARHEAVATSEEERRVTRGNAVAFGATLVTVALSVTAVFVTMTYLSLLATSWSLGTGSTSVALSAFGAAGLAGALVVGRYLDDHRPRVLGVAASSLIVGMGTLWVAPPSALALVLAMTLVGCGAVAVPLTCQHMLFDNSPLSIPMALALSSLAFNVGVAAGGAIGGEIVVAGLLDCLAPSSLLLAVLACAAALFTRGDHAG